MTALPTLRQDPTSEAAPDRTELLLYGSDPTTGIVAVERAGTDRVVVYARGPDGQQFTIEDQFRPWLVADRAEPWAALPSRPAIIPLAGEHRLCFLVSFPSWPEYLNAERAARDAGETFFRLRSPIEQYLVRSGRTLFKGMVFEDLRRVQLDIETTGLDPNDPTAELIGVALRTSSGDETYVGRAPGEPEEPLIEAIEAWLHDHNPDVLEGHNVFNFDLPFLVARAARLGVPLRWGRDGSPPRIGQGQQRFKVAALTLPFTPCYVHGRHVVDTYQQIQRYDTAGKLTSYALKRIMRDLGLEREEREFVRPERIREIWLDPDGRDRLARYALDDVRDVDALARLTVPTEFYQAQLLPRPFQSVATGGPGEKINDLLLRAYLSQGHSIPLAQNPREYPGGHAELLGVGAFAPVVKCDVESLYPSIMLGEGISSASDVLNASLPMLAELTRRRLEAKSQARRTEGRERAMWEGLQSSFKVLINSFYGYLGYGGGLLNDYDAAERVTLAGQRIVKRVVEELQATGATPIEVDTDGVYFVPPPDVRTEAEEVAYVEHMGAALPDGIRLAHDGRYAGMLSLRLKTYALLGHDGGLLLKGSALRSRRMEPCFRAFLAAAAAGFLANRRDEVREGYFALAERIRRRELEVSEFSQWGLLSDQMAASQPRVRRLIDRLKLDVQTGDRVEVYERQDGELATVDEYASDESVPYLLRRLRDVAERFRALFPTDAEFDAFFPALSARTDLEAARAQEAAQQLSLFGS
jgi:DNA polymerase elongation subunit (family B)